MPLTIFVLTFLWFCFCSMESSWSWSRENIILNDAGGDLTQNWDHVFSSSSWMILPSWSSWCFAFKVDTCQPGAILRIQNALIATCFKNKGKMDFGKLDFLGCLANGMRFPRTHRRNQARNGIRIPISLDENPNFQWCWLGCFLPQMILRGWNLIIFLGGTSHLHHFGCFWKIMWDYFMMNLCNSFRPQSPPFGLVEAY